MSKIFKAQHQVLLDVVWAERSSGWTASSQKEIVMWLTELVKIAEDTD